MLSIAYKLLTDTVQKVFEIRNVTLGSKYRLWENIWVKFELLGHGELWASLPLQM